MADIYDWQLARGPQGAFQRVRRGERVIVNAWERGVVLRAGEVAGTLPTGRHRLWQANTKVAVLDLRPYVLVVPTQEIPTADGLTVKVTVAGQARIEDPVAYLTGAQAPSFALHLDVQVALREVVAATTVDELVSGRAEVTDRLRDRLQVDEALGLVVERLELRDIILPADLKKAQAQVLLARAEGQAALERARGETAALRNLANAARLAADNPALLQLRLLQELGASSGHTVVIGTPPGLAITTPSG